MIFSNTSRYFGVKNPYQSPDIKEDRAIYLQSLFCALGAVAKADGEVCDQETSYVQFLFKQHNLNLAEQQVAESAFAKGIKGEYNPDIHFKQMRLKTGSNPAINKKAISSMIEMAAVSGGVDKRQKLIIDQAVEQLGLANVVYQRLIRSFVDARKASHQQSKTNSEYLHACKILGVRPQSEYTVIRLHYKRLVQRNHPDKLGPNKLHMKGAYENKIKLLSDAFKVIERHYKKR